MQRGPEFRHGHLRLMMADKGKSCGATRINGLAAYDQAHHVYQDTEGNTVLRQDSGA